MAQSNSVTVLISLKGRIATAFEAVDKALKNSDSARIKAGQLLIEARELVEDGKWQAWCTENVKRGFRDVQKCIKMAAAENPEEAAAEAREKVRLQVAASRKTKAERQEATSKVESETRKKAQKAAVAVVEKGQYPDDWKKHAQNVVAAGAAARRELEFFATLRGGEQQIFLALVVETAKATLHKAIAKVANSKPKAPKLTNADIPVAHIPRPEIATVN